MNKILVVEDSATMRKVLVHMARQELRDVEMVITDSLSGARAVLAEHGGFFAAVVDLNLPDAPNGEVVEWAMDHRLPSIVLTASYDDKRRERLIELGVVDYVVKESRHSYSYLFRLINRLLKNRDIKILIADDSATARRFLSEMLSRHLYQVIEASDGLDACDKLKRDPEIKLLITDYAMPQMDGVALVNHVRDQFDKPDLAIIGLSSVDSGGLTAKFIKSGANDFLKKPFSQEELHCRVMHNIEAIEHIQTIRDAASRDYLTGLYNRRYFFEEGERLCREAQQSNRKCALGMLDIDHFKQVNDSYGHEAGDVVLKQLATLINNHLGRFLCARMGGEEFCILMAGVDQEQGLQLFDGLRQICCREPISAGTQTITVTFSGGVIGLQGEDLDSAYSRVDEVLYRAKDAGRNLVLHDL